MNFATLLSPTTGDVLLQINTCREVMEVGEHCSEEVGIGIVVRGWLGNTRMMRNVEVQVG